MNSKEYNVARSALGRLEYVPRRDEVTGRPHKKLKNRLVNVPIQSTGVDLFKLASGLLYKEFCKPEFSEFQFLLSLHDSVLLECPTERSEECSELVNSVFMAAAGEIFQDAPCKADVKVGSDWSFAEVGTWLGLIVIVSTATTTTTAGRSKCRSPPAAPPASFRIDCSGNERYPADRQRACFVGRRDGGRHNRAGGVDGSQVEDRGPPSERRNH